MRRQRRYRPDVENVDGALETRHRILEKAPLEHAQSIRTIRIDSKLSHRIFVCIITVLFRIDGFTLNDYEENARTGRVSAPWNGGYRRVAAGGNSPTTQR